MGFIKIIVFCLMVSTTWTRHHHHHHHGHSAERDEVDHFKRIEFQDKMNDVTETGEKSRGMLNVDRETKAMPFSTKRLEKMLEKAILKIITGDLSTADMLLLKSLNYSLEEVLAIRERELGRRKDEELRQENKLKSERDLLKKKRKHWNHTELNFSPRTLESAEQRSGGAEKAEKRKKPPKTNEKSYDDFDFDAYNRQAVIDYENLASKSDVQQSWSDPIVLHYEETTKEPKEKDSSSENLHRSFDKAMEPHVVFKIRYDDSEFDSSSSSGEDRSKSTFKEHTTARHHHHHHRHGESSTLRHASTTSRNTGSSFHASLPSSSSSLPVHTPIPVVYQLGNFNEVLSSRTYSNPRPPSEVTTLKSASDINGTADVPDHREVVVEVSTDGQGSPLADTTDEAMENALTKEESEAVKRRVGEYEGLEWVEDDVYRVIPEVADSLGYENVNDENETSNYEDEGGSYYRNENDTSEYQNDTPDPVKLFMANTNLSTDNQIGNLSTYQQLALAHRREGNISSSFDSQGQKAIEDIKSRVLALTGRFNHTANQVQRERLTMFSPTCQIPRNTDPEAWADPFSMNMYFQLNLTSGDHVAAAKLRIFRLPQENFTSPVSVVFEEEEEEERKIRISVYFYMKSLRKHRSKKRLMDSIMTSLTPNGTHLALDVRQGLTFWRTNSRNLHGGGNHGLVIQVEDQDGRPLKPALYIQQPSCADHESDQKAYQRLPALFV